MPYTDDQIKDYAFKLENAGAPASEIEEFVKQAKQEQGGQPTQQLQPQASPTSQPTQQTQTQSSQNKGIFGLGPAKVPGANLPSPLSQQGQQNIIEGLKKAPGATANFLTESTLKPIARGVAAPVSALYRNVEGAIQGTGKLLQGQGLEAAKEVYEENLTKPVNIYGLGNVNPLRANEQGKIDPGKSALKIGGIGADAALGALNTFAPVQGLVTQPGKYVAQNALRGAIQSGAKEATYNEDANLGSIAGNAAVGGTISGVLSALPVGLNKVRELRAQGAGLSDEAISTLRNKELGQKTLNTVKDAKKALSNPTENLNPLQNVGQKEFKPAVDQLFQRNKELGKQLGTVIKESGIQTNLTKPYDSFVGKIKDLGGKIGKNGIEFNEFSPIDNPSDIKQLNTIFGTLNKYKNKPIPASDLHALIQKADNLLDYSTKTANPLSTPAESAIKEFRKSASELLKNKVPQSKPLFNQFADNRKALDFFNPKLGENASSASVLKNIFSPQRKDELLPLLQNLEKNTGKQIINPSRVAKTAMDIAGDTRGASLLDTSANPKNIIAKLIQATVAKPEGSAKGIVKSSLGKGILSGVGKSGRIYGISQGLTSARNAVPQALSEGILNLFRNKDTRTKSLRK